MYYNSNKSNNDYYNSYKQEIRELEAYNKEETLQKVLKLSLSILTLTLFILGSFFLYKYFYPTIQQSTINKPTIEAKNDLKPLKILPKLIISENKLPQSVQFTDLKVDTKKQENVNMNAQDVALIVQIIMSQMNEKTEIPLEEQLVNVEKKKFKTHTLKEGNYYNKIILTSNETDQVQNSALVELTNNINNVLNEPEEGNKDSEYFTEIKKEVVFRTNEMRIIIVQKGDTLSRIAKKAYGNYDAYPRIFAANPEIIKNPDQIFVGQRLRIPS